MLAIDVTCNRCGIEFSPDREAFTRGTWHTCRRCQADPVPKVSGALTTNPTPQRGTQRAGMKRIPDHDRGKAVKHAESRSMLRHHARRAPVPGHAAPGQAALFRP